MPFTFCNVVGFKKGSKGDPGELKGLFLRNGNVFGSLDKNCKCSVYGTFNEKQLDYDESVVVTVLEENEKMYVVSFSPEEL